MRVIGADKGELSRKPRAGKLTIEFVYRLWPRVDIFLANKGERFGLREKTAFIDAHGLAHYVAQSRAAFEKQLLEEQQRP